MTSTADACCSSRIVHHGGTVATLNSPTPCRVWHRLLLNSMTSTWWRSSCNRTALLFTARIFSRAFVSFAPVIMLPTLFFQRHKLLSSVRSAFSVVSTALFHLCRSSVFLGSMVGVFVRLLCVARRMRGRDSYVNTTVSGFLSGFAVLFESDARRTDLALYLLPFAWEIIYGLLVGKGFLRYLRHGEVLVFALSMSCIMYFYQFEQHAIKPTYLAAMSWLFGDN
eukprot:gnl/Spiro4/28633_TR14169_c0_g1_i1.p1 gnl/Spiro4/28633_TR14169_c0_g1~~gnl/Spiro4/28633_TR14169_c0_g1_i1.p1  ORF type:complete len:224 (+),score=30.38 gnl/Spiro4/28633_TR14169_c0_g1_i1:115-786(+)